MQVSAAAGKLQLTLGDDKQQLVHTGEHRPRSDDGFIIFDAAAGHASGLTIPRDSEGVRRAVRRP